MTHADTITAFYGELDKLVERFRDEFELPYATAVGCLTLKAQQLGLDVIRPLDDPDDGEEWKL